MPMSATRPLTTSSKSPVDILQNCVVGQQRQQMSELQFDKFPTPSSFLLWKTRFKTQVSSGSDFPSEAMLWIKEVEMADYLDELKSSRPVYGRDFPNFEMLDAKIASFLNKIIQNSQFKKEGQPRGPESTKRGPVLRGRHIAFTIDDYFRVTGARDAKVVQIRNSIYETLTPGESGAVA